MSAALSSWRCSSARSSRWAHSRCQRSSWKAGSSCWRSGCFSRVPAASSGASSAPWCRLLFPVPIARDLSWGEIYVMKTAPHDRGTRVAVWIGSVIWVLAACSSPAGTSPSPAAGASPSPAATATSVPPPIKVGVLDDQTGLGATEGALMRISTQLAVDRANAVGGINGHHVMPVYMDPQSEATTAIQVATQLAQQEK